MKLGLFVPLGAPVATPDVVARLGRESEALGFASLWLAEHIDLDPPGFAISPPTPRAVPTR